MRYWKQQTPCSLYTRKGVEIIVGEDDYSYLSQYHWHINSNGLVCRARQRTDPEWIPQTQLVVLGRLLLGYPPQHMRVYHRNRNKLDCRKSNLILVPTKTHLEWSHEEKVIPEHNWTPLDWRSVVEESWPDKQWEINRAV